MDSLCSTFFSIENKDVIVVILGLLDTVADVACLKRTCKDLKQIIDKNMPILSSMDYYSGPGIDYTIFFGKYIRKIRDQGAGLHIKDFIIDEESFQRNMLITIFDENRNVVNITYNTWYGTSNQALFKNNVLSEYTVYAMNMPLSNSSEYTKIMTFEFLYIGKKLVVCDPIATDK
jgi:hypothetical protein